MNGVSIGGFAEAPRLLPRIATAQPTAQRKRARVRFGYRPEVPPRYFNNLKMSKKQAKAECAAPISEEGKLYNKPAHAVPLAIARQRPENRKENQAGHSSSANQREIELREWVSWLWVCNISSLCVSSLKANSTPSRRPQPPATPVSSSHSDLRALATHFLALLLLALPSSPEQHRGCHGVAAPSPRSPPRARVLA